MVRVTGFEPAAMPRKRRHGRTAIRKGMPQVRNRLSMKNEEPPGGDSSFLVRVTGFEPAASCSQSRRATSCATPGHRRNGLAPLRRRTQALPMFAVCASASPFLLSKTNPLCWASFWLLGSSTPQPDTGSAYVCQLRIHFRLLPFQIKPATLGFDSVIFYPQGFFK